MRPTICEVVDQIEVVLVVDCSEMCLGNSHTDTICETLAERTSGHLDSCCKVSNKFNVYEKKHLPSV